jgi:hypothetical protein
MDKQLIAPCGMDCGLCRAYLAFTHDVKSKGIRTAYCKGCRPRNKQCAFLKKKCSLLLNGSINFCYECGEFPCERLSRLDTRYRAEYKMSMVQNLKDIKNQGLPAFLIKQSETWRCPECGGVICCHNGICYDCGLDRLRETANLCRWEARLPPALG